MSSLLDPKALPPELAARIREIARVMKCSEEEALLGIALSGIGQVNDPTATGLTGFAREAQAKLQAAAKPKL